MITSYQIQMDTFRFNTSAKDYDQTKDTILVDSFNDSQDAEWCFEAISIPEGYKRANTPLPKEYSHELIIYSLLEYSETVNELRHVYFVTMKD